MRLKIAWMVLAAALPLAESAHAIPIRYNLEFYVSEVSIEYPDNCGLDVYFYVGFDCRPQVGDRYRGYIVLPDWELTEDGIGQSAELKEFYVKIEGVEWRLSKPFPQSHYWGFRGPGDNLPYYELGGVPSPGLDIFGGQLVNLRGGVFSELDSPFIDFTAPSCGTSDPFATCHLGIREYASFDGFNTRIMGTYTITRVSEPTAPLLFAAALAFLYLRTRNRLRRENDLRETLRPSESRQRRDVVHVP